MTALTSLTIAEARDGLANKSFTSLELTDAHLTAIEAARALNAFVLETPEQARAVARAVDAKIARGEGGPRAGMPVGSKDLVGTRDGGNPDRPRRLDPPAGRVHRDRGPEADLWPLLALGHRGVCILPRPGRPDRAHRARYRDPDALDGRPRSQGHDVGRSRSAGLRGRGRKVRQGHEDRDTQGIPSRRHAGRNRKALERGRGLAR